MTHHIIYKNAFLLCCFFAIIFIVKTFYMAAKVSNVLVVSWNVLHIIHELNYASNSSPILEQYRIKDDFGNEQKRLKDIVVVLQRILRDHLTNECFVCLQEVPGDLIPLLEEMLVSTTKSSSIGNAILYKQIYLRHPRLRHGKNDSLYHDSSEYLVTIHYQPKDRIDKIFPKVSWTPCPVDKGKGAFGLTTSHGLTILNVHVPYDYQAADALLAHISWPKENERFLMVGDMNRGSSSLKKALTKVTKDPIDCVTTEKATRIGVDENGIRNYMTIDFFVVSPLILKSVVSLVEVIDDIGDISDHFPILLELSK